MGRAVSGSMPSALGLRAPKAQREWARPLINWLPKLRRTGRLKRTRLPKPLSSWPRIVPVSFMGQSLPLMEGALPFEVCGRHGGHMKNMNVSMTVNGSVQAITVEPRMTLLDALRDVLRLTGPKKACDRGECGACTVLTEGRRVLSCMTLAAIHGGQEITTIEALEQDGHLHPLQQAFIEHDGFQCGFCTSGQIMSAAGMLHEPWGPADDDVREAMSGNLCRCGAYPGIVAAIQQVRHGTAQASKREQGGDGR